MSPTTRITAAYRQRPVLARWLALGLLSAVGLGFWAGPFAGADIGGWSSGFNHPWKGWDHLVTMLAVGIWAAQLRGRAVWMLPLAFVGVMSLGGLAGAAGLAIPSMEGLILLSCAVFAVLIGRRVSYGTTVNLAIVAFFAFFHGLAHGQEISASASLLSYTAGFMLATLLLHGAGFLVAKLAVLVAAFLLTACFSNIALAKAAPPAFAAESLAIEGFEAGHLPAWQSVERVSEAVSASARRGMAQAVADCELRRGLAETADGGGWPESGLALIAPDDGGSAHIRFKHFFPSINHTPGKSLLSNGVGLTSPPALPVVSARFVFAPLDTFPIFPAENHCFRAMLAASGGLTFVTFSDSRYRPVDLLPVPSLRFAIAPDLASRSPEARRIGGFLVSFAPAHFRQVAARVSQTLAGSGQGQHQNHKNNEIFDT